MNQVPKHLHQLYPLKAGAEIYIMCKNQVLMFRRGSASPMFPNVWVGPGGHVDTNEDFLKAALREVYEETGVKASADSVSLKALAIHRRPEKQTTWILPVFLTKILELQTTRNSHEGVAEWIDKDELFKMNDIFPSARYYLDHVLNDKPGILYTNLVWTDTELVEESSVTYDKNY
jgi:8-oxo-dGTP pyrophosphatase MutT (NUDIX family)